MLYLIGRQILNLYRMEYQTELTNHIQIKSCIDVIFFLLFIVRTHFGKAYRTLTIYSLFTYLTV